jgi:hypothetical protein
VLPLAAKQLPRTGVNDVPKPEAGQPSSPKKKIDLQIFQPGGRSRDFLRILNLIQAIVHSVQSDQEAERQETRPRIPFGRKKTSTNVRTVLRGSGT